MSAPVSLAWRDHAACAGSSIALFFPRLGSMTREAEARKVCWGCEPRAACLEFALEHDEAGFWGGLAERDRRAFLTAERKGAPLGRYRSARQFPNRRAALEERLVTGIKHCPGCGDKPFAEFGVNASSPDGRQGVCRECRSAPQPKGRGARHG